MERLEDLEPLPHILDIGARADLDRWAEGGASDAAIQTGDN
jgi:hypothetical protein